MEKAFEQKNFFIGDDGMSYATSQELNVANKRYKDTHYTFICSNCRQHIQARVYVAHQKFCKPQKLEKKFLDL